MPAALYDVNKETLTYMQFKSIMLSLPEFVNEDDVASMFEAADSDCSGRISYAEFRRMCIVPRGETIPDEPPLTEEEMLQQAAEAKLAEEHARQGGSANGHASGHASAATNVTGLNTPRGSGSENPSRFRSAARKVDTVVTMLPSGAKK